jgi:hypothetical protein
MTITELQTMRRLLLGLLTLVERALAARGVPLKTISTREIHHW